MANESDSGSVYRVPKGFDAAHSHWKIENLERVEGDEEFRGVILARCLCHQLLREASEF